MLFIAMRISFTAKYQKINVSKIALRRQCGCGALEVILVFEYSLLFIYLFINEMLTNDENRFVIILSKL